MRVRRRAAVAVTASALFVVAASCSGGTSSSKSASTTGASTAGSSPSSSASTTVAVTTTTALPPVVLGPMNVTVAPVIGVNDLTLDAAVRDKVTAALNAYVEQAMTAPMQGKPSSVDALLTADAARHLKPEQKTSLVDDSTGKAKTATVERSAASLTGFAGPSDDVSVVNATVDIAVKASLVDGRTLSLARSGDITFVVENGAWKIDSFQLTVKRDLA